MARADGVIRQRKVRLTYASSAKVRSERLVDPWGLVDKGETWYLIAGTEQGRRTFRVDRILEAEPTGQPAARPDDFTLASAWEKVAGEVEQRRARTWATVLIDARFVPVLRDHFGRHCHAGSQLDDGRARVRIAAPTPLDIARNLAGWGAMIEVIEPRTVQAELARIGAELAGQYDQGTGQGDLPARCDGSAATVDVITAARSPTRCGPPSGRTPAEASE
jgi:predicted DNA-binding transcriptional regulator YafY